jgi:four helix bundle protein
MDVANRRSAIADCYAAFKMLSRVSMGIEYTPQTMQDRLIRHASTIVEVTSGLPKTLQAGHVSRQLLRAGTAAAANYAEARGAESRPDFVHKLRIVLKELNETVVWLKLIIEASMLPVERMTPILKENEELCRMIAASIKTAGGFGRS